MLAASRGAKIRRNITDGRMGRNVDAWWRALVAWMPRVVGTLAYIVDLAAGLLRQLLARHKLSLAAYARNTESTTRC